MKNEVKKKMNIDSRKVVIPKSRCENFEGKSQLNFSRELPPRSSTGLREHMMTEPGLICGAITD
jgi:hypothetical protein